MEQLAAPRGGLFFATARPDRSLEYRHLMSSTQQNTVSHEHLAALDAAIAQGVTSVSYDGKTVSYRRLDDMLKIRDWLRRELGLARPGRRSRRAVVHL